MSRRSVLAMLAVLLTLALLLQAGASPAAADDAKRGADFVRQAAGELRLNGKPFRFGGTNNYYLMYKSKTMVDNLLTTAAASDLRVIRMWGSLEIGDPNGSDSIHNWKPDGVYFQYWAGDGPAFNDGENGLQRLDYAVYKAGALGIRVVIPFVNNWNAFGGMDQYVRWRGGQYHDEFYTDPVIRQWYKTWINHLLNRTNVYTGVKYKDDPTILMWELANEPRCKSAGAYPTSAACTTQTLIAWADEMSRFIKSIDTNHLVSVGDEGFYCIPGATDWTENCGEGVDTIAFARLNHIDVLSAHLYPDHWGKDAAWGTQWIRRHAADARAVKKPFVLGEFGLQDKARRNAVYREWLDAAYQGGAAGALYWILSDKEDNGAYYADYDGFTVYCPSPVCTTIKNFAWQMAGRMVTFPPVADHDNVLTEFNTPVTLSPLANDVTYSATTLVVSTLDLDPTRDGFQSTVSVSGGVFAAQPDGKVVFTPTAGFVGKASAAYTVRDSWGRASNTATMTVTVKPNPSAPITLFSFETGTEGWGPGSWQTGAGSVAQSAAFHTDGAFGLQVNSTGGAWFGLDLPGSVDLTGKSHFKFDLQTGADGTSRSVALKLGSGYTWCQTGWGWINGGTTTTVDVDLLQDLGCSGADLDLTKLQGIYIWFSTGAFHIDNVRAE